MAKITETKTENEWKEVTETETIKKTQCDVCEDAWTEDEDMEIHEFSINPDFRSEYHSLDELSDLVRAYYTWVDVAQVEDVDEPRNISTPREKPIEAVRTELSLIEDGATFGMNNPIDAKKYADGLGTLKFYVDGDKIHHFMYEVDIEATSDTLKHVCDDCYSAVFE